MLTTPRALFAVAISAAALALPALSAPQGDGAFYAGLRWRLVGPYRAGQIASVAGVVGDPAVYYLGTPGGGVWKTTDGGTVWHPISASIPSASIGVVAVARSNPAIVYAGTGNTMIGSGVYRSSDAGATWRHAGLDETKYITALLVDPDDPSIVLAGAGSGGNFGSMVFDNDNPSAARGVYRSTDAGRTWTHTLFVDAGSSLVDLAADPAAPRVVFASLTAPHAAGQSGPPIYRSDDDGVTWTRLTAKGLPSEAGFVNLAVAPGTGDRRLYALAAGRGARGVFRSDDGGESWTLGTSRIASASGHLYVDPKNPDLVYTMGTSMYRSTDGARTFASYKGAPGGDDNKVLWIDPQSPGRMIMGADQGPTITLDGGRSWTPWYVLPNGEFYYVSTDNQFPYWIYSAQQDSGTVAIRSRSDYGAIRPNDWYPVSGYEEGHIFADPFNPRYVYSHGNGHAVVRFDRDTGQVGPVYTPREPDRFGPRPAMEMSAKDPHWLFLGAQYVLATSDRGATWRQISPDLTVRPDGSSAARAGERGGPTIVALAPSPLDVNLLWAGTSNGLIHLTRDMGKSWTDVSPPRLVSEQTLALWSIDASPHDPGVAYATATDVSDRHGPCIFRTTDFGRTWQTIVEGLPADVPTRVVREDPRDANLLYLGTHTGMYVSFDRGDHWRSLQLNLPAAVVNDITIHDDDVAIATYGRALWILDDVTPLRQIAAARASSDAAFLFEPAAAWRVRWDNNQDTPLPPEVPAGQNPPDGAILDYYLRTAAPGVTLSIRDAAGRLVREFTDAAPAAETAMPNVPDYWFSAPAIVESGAGMHRFVWDLRYPTPPSLDYGANGAPADSTSYGLIAPAIVGRSPRQQPVGPLALPGTYDVRLGVSGRTYRRSLVVKNDPRSQIAPGDLEAQLQQELRLTAGIARSGEAIDATRALAAAASRAAASTPAASAAARAFDRAARGVVADLAKGRQLAELLASLEYADLKPTASTVAAVDEGCARADAALDRYRELVRTDLASLNASFATANLAPLTAPAASTARACQEEP